MVGTTFLGVVRAVQRIAWWVFVIAAVATGRLDWWPWGDGRVAPYDGAYSSLSGITTSEPTGTALISQAEVGGPPWAGPVTLIAAALVLVAAASASTVVRSTNWEGSVIALAGAAVAVGTVATAVNGFDDNSFGSGVMVVLVVVGAAVHEAAMATSASSWRSQTTL